MIEFAFVLPIFLLLVMGILDFGFLFYNYISLENAARNASRVACVEYGEIAYGKRNQEDGDNKFALSPRVLTLPTENATQKSAYDSKKLPVNDTTSGSFSDGYTEAEIRVCMEVARSLERTGIDSEGRTISIVYTYDTSEAVMNEGWKLNKRPDGDVTVTVEADAHVLTPVLGVTADNMKKHIASSATYKVEEQYTED